jgi:hypothetical protein
MKKRWISKGSLISGVGSLVASRWIHRDRKRWEKTDTRNGETILDNVKSYDTARGAGRLLAEWLTFTEPNADLDYQELRLQALLKQMDPEDNQAEERAISRLLVSKALFHLEGFKLTVCRYETYQTAARDALRKNPKWRNATRNELFQALPFEPEFLLGTVHRMLLTLDDGQLSAFITFALENLPLRDDSDYLARLIALTLGEEGEALPRVMDHWFEEYRTFKINQTHRREALVNTSVAVVSGELPSMIGMDLLGRLFRGVRQGKGKKPR